VLGHFWSILTILPHIHHLYRLKVPAFIHGYDRENRQQRFTIRSVVLTGSSSRQHSAISSCPCPNEQSLDSQTDSPMPRPVELKNASPRNVLWQELAIYRACQKSNPLGKSLYLWNCSKFFSSNLRYLHRRIRATCPASFITILGCIQKL